MQTKIDGQELLITPASLTKAFALQKALADALRADGINIDIGTLDFNTEDPTKSEVGEKTVGSLIENVLAVATSPVVLETLFACCETATFGKNRTKIDAEFFEEVENRQYFYPIMVEVLKVNLGPFFKKIGSLLGGLSTMIGSTQK
jgi:hypothetical protein